MIRRTRLSMLLAAVLVAGPAAAQITMLAFGDSITEGDGDSCTRGPGYPPRLQRQLQNRGDDVFVVNDGLGGETTAGGLSRIDSVLDQGGDYLLLMEGTNDISHRVSSETIWNNLNTMATDAEMRGMVAVHATVIPRKPTATHDSDNVLTGELAQVILANAPLAHRAVADLFDDYLSIPDVFQTLYWVNDQDPVGHPNCLGYDEMSGVFLATVAPLVETPPVAILPPPQPITTATEVTFSLSGAANYVSATWSFGDGGFAYATTQPLAARYVYARPGTYTVHATLTAGDGSTFTATATVVVAGAAPAYASRVALLPLVVESDSGTAATVDSDLVLTNAGSQTVLAAIAFDGEVAYDAPPAAVQLIVDPGATVNVPDLLATAFALPDARGSAIVTWRALSASSLSSASASIAFHFASGGATASLGEIDSSRWSGGQEQMGGLTGDSASTATVSIANLDAVDGYVRLDLLDAGGANVGSAVVEVAPGEVGLRDLAALFRGAAGARQPLTAVLRASSIRFAGAVLAADPPATLVVLSGTP